VADSKEGLDEFALEEIGLLHAIAADLFVPFVIRRLSKTRGDRFCDLTVELFDIGGIAHATQKLRSGRHVDRRPGTPPPDQDPPTAVEPSRGRRLCRDRDLRR
jgi:hypothetical protein